MTTSMCCRMVFITVLLASAARSGAAVVYDESTAPDLSGNGLASTFISVAAGSNQIFGTTGNPGTGVDRDYFTITVPVGYQLSQLFLLPGSSVSGGSSFIGVQAGTQVTLPTNPSSATGLLGWTHYSNSEVGTDLLPTMAVPSDGSTGFGGALGAGSYAFWVQDFGGGVVPYGFDLVITAVPEPNGLVLALAGIGGLSALRYRRRHRGGRPE